MVKIQVPDGFDLDSLPHFPPNGQDSAQICSNCQLQYLRLMALPVIEESSYLGLPLLLSAALSCLHISSQSCAIDSKVGRIVRALRATRAARLEACRSRYRVSSPALSESGFSPRVSRLVSSLAGWLTGWQAGWLARSPGIDYILCPLGFRPPCPHLSPTVASFWVNHLSLQSGRDLRIVPLLARSPVARRSSIDGLSRNIPSRTRRTDR